MSSKKHSNATAQSSRGSASISKGQMQLTLYLDGKNWNAMDKLWNFFSGVLYEPWEVFLNRNLDLDVYLPIYLGCTVKLQLQCIIKKSKSRS